jgi:hypothetical protein
MHRIALKSRVRLEAPRSQALLSSQYLCGSSRPDTSHVIHEISIQDVQGNWTRVKALIDCGATTEYLRVTKVDRDTRPRNTAGPYNHLRVGREHQVSR